MKPTTKRRLVAITAGLAVVWVSFVGFVDWAMHQPPEKFGHVMAHMPVPAYILFPFGTMWTQVRHGHLNLGDQAPDFTVTTLESRRPIQPATLWNVRDGVLLTSPRNQTERLGVANSCVRRLAIKSRPGPFGFHPEELAGAIGRSLQR